MGELFIHGLLDGQFSTIKLSINWYPSSYVSTISTTLANLIYLVGTGSKVDVGDFIFLRCIRQHIDTFSINISICFPYLLCGFLLSQHPSILIEANVICLASKVLLPLGYLLF